MTALGTNPGDRADVRGESGGAGALVPLRGQNILGDWNIVDVTGGFPGAISVNLARPSDGASLQLAVMPSGSGKAFWSTGHGDVFYRRFSGIDSEEAVATTGSFADLLQRGALPLALYFPHLAIHRDANDGPLAARDRFVHFLAAQRLLLGGPSGGDEGLNHGRAADGALQAPEMREELYFDAQGIAEFLAPEVSVDGEAVAGHVLRSIYLPPVGRRQTADYRAYALEFDSGEDDKLVRLELRYGDNERAVFGECGPLKVAVLGFEGDPESLPPHLTSLCSWLLALLYLRAPGELRIVVPSSAEQLRCTSWPPAGGGSATQAAARTNTAAGTNAADAGRTVPALNLTLDADCHQACTFCSVKSYVEPFDRGEVELEAIQLQLQRACDAGVEEVRLNGIDPLAYSCVLDVVAAVRDLGFRRLSIYSPGRQLASREFRSALLDRAPAELEVTIPLYGVTAAVHDAVTGLPGSHAQVLAAIEGLVDLLGPRRPDRGDGDARWWSRWGKRREAARPVAGERCPIRLSTVIVKQNVDELPALLRFAGERGLLLDARVPYPMRQTVRDPYAESALRETEIVHRFVAGTRHFAMRERFDAARVLGRAVLHPCVLFRVEQAGGVPLFGAHDIGKPRILHGTEYRSADFVHADDGSDSAFAVATVPCPHVETCALASTCPREHYAVYSDLFGLDEFTPVSVDDLYAVVPTGDVEEFRRMRRS